MIDPDRARLVAAVVVILVVIAALGIALVLRGLFGVPKVSGPRCRACRQLLRAFGPEPALPSVCPECGAELKDESHIVHAVRVHRPWTAAIGAACLVVAGVVAAVGRPYVVRAAPIVPGPPIAATPPPAAPVPAAPVPAAPWPAELTFKQLEEYERQLGQVPNAVFLASATAGLGRSRAYLSELVDRLMKGEISESELREVFREVADRASQETGWLAGLPQAGLVSHLTFFNTGSGMPPWLREELLWLAAGAPFIAVPLVTDGSVPIRIAPRSRPVRNWLELPPEIHAVRLVGDGMDLELPPIPQGRWVYDIPLMVPRGRYEIRIDLERIARHDAPARSGRGAVGSDADPPMIRRRTEFVRTLDLAWPGEPLVRLVPDPEFANAIRAAFSDTFVRRHRREGRPDFLQVLGMDRSWRRELPGRPAIYRLDVLVGDVRIATDHIIHGPSLGPIGGRGPRGELEPGELPDPLPATVTLEFHPEPDVIDDYALRATSIPGDVIHITDIPLIVDPGPEWLPDG